MSVKEKSAPARFYYQLMGQVIGPINGTQLRQAAVDSDIDQFTPVRIGHQSEWIPASRLTKLFHSDGTPIRFEELGTDHATHQARVEANESASNDFMTMMSEIDTHEPRRLTILDLRFQKFVTPQLIRILYLVSIAGSLAAIGLSFYWGFDGTPALAEGDPSLAVRFAMGTVSAIATLVVCSLGLIAVRVGLEAVMVFFRMCKHLENISRLTAKSVH